MEGPMNPRNRYTIGNDLAEAATLPAARLAAKTLWEEGATGLNRPPLWVYRGTADDWTAIGYWAADGWTASYPGRLV
jgi:hypothetical protein